MENINFCPHNDGQKSNYQLFLFVSQGLPLDKIALIHHKIPYKI